MDECARMNCDKTAVALLTFLAQETKAWLYDLDRPDPTGGIMLCRKHANATVVPMSWQLIDSRDPAWPGPATDQPLPVVAPTPSFEEIVSTAELPSDVVAIDAEFAGLDENLPVTPRPYAEPQLATALAAGRSHQVQAHTDSDTAAVTPDPSLFELPLSDIPAVTAHPDY